MIRVQQRRGKKLPAGVKSVARPSRWGNPYKVEDYGREQAVILYRDDMNDMTDSELGIFLAPLKDASGLACYCSLDEACHADVLIEQLELLYGSKDT